MNVKHKELSFQLMVEASPISLVLVNSYGKIAYLNSYAEKLFLYNKNELIGRDLSILLPQKYRSHHPDLLKDYFTNPVTRQMGENRDLYALKKDNVEFPVEIGLNPIVTVEGTLVLAAIIDITERKKANEQFRLVVESAPNAMILADYSGTIVMVNKQTEILFGYERDELVGQKVELLVPGKLKQYHPQLRDKFYAKPQARPMGVGRDLFGLRKDGTEIPIEIGLNPLEKNESQFVLASIIDITERKKNEEAIRLYTKRIEAKNKELEQFSFIASHDLREPLNSITSLIGLLLEEDAGKMDAEMLKRMDFIAKSSSRMKDLVKGLLDYARLGKNSEFGIVDFNEIVAIVVNDLELLVKNSGAEINVKRLPVIAALEVEVHSLFQNLISNAIKYRSKDRKPKIEISAQKVENGWEFVVRDNGIGIPKNQQERIFVIFQRLHGRNEYEGIGVGLAHCRKIVELHDGKIWVESEPEKGSTFYFFIPLK
ncbi:PAS domain S-box protein [Maribellus comscasis]|uniref:histidine kinase n=1 Tax=Maribellus comscasis TaxID=2681766 RepID=A0A6I6JKN4_9BACT|nr:PAS domain S-box protein [Maribellus comscasis]QGY42881.1 PAS domain S-box protein [Maribellus comscasis]